MFRGKTQKGDWVRHNNGAVGTVQDWGYWSMADGFHRSSRKVSLASVMPAVKVATGNQLIWWAFQAIEGKISAPSLWVYPNAEQGDSRG